MSEWEGGSRQRVRRRRVGVGLLLVAAVAAAAYAARQGSTLTVDTDAQPIAGASEHLEGVVRRPSSGGARWSCPPTHPVRAYDAEGAYYPAGYPRGTGVVRRPDACYDTPERAAAAGLRLAEPPAGTVAVQGIYLEPTRSPTRADCSEIATAVRYTVPCPSRLPAPADRPRCSDGLCIVRAPGRPAAGRARSVGVVVQHRGFTVPPEPPWLGVPRDVVVTAVPVARGDLERGLRVAGPPELVSCFPEDGIVAHGPTVLRTCVDARPWAPGLGGGYPLQRHTAAVWRRGGVVYAAGIEGAGDHVEALLTTLIDGIQYIDPS